MNILKSYIPVLLLLLLLGSCKKEPRDTIDSPVPYITSSSYQWADSLLITLSPEQKIGQLLLWEYSNLTPDALPPVLTNYELSGVVLTPRSLLQHLDLVSYLQRTNVIPPFIASTASNLFNNQLSGVEDLLPESIINATSNDTLFDHLNSLAAKQAIALQINLNISQPVNAQQLTGDRLQTKRIQAFDDKKIISIAYNFADYYPHLEAGSQRLQTLLKPGRLLTEKGIGGFVLDQQLPSRIQTTEAGGNYQNYFQERLGFDGLLLRPTANAEMAIRHLQSGVDVLWLQTAYPGPIADRIKNALETGELTMEEIDQKVRKVLMAKKWMYNGFDNHQPNSQTSKRQWPIPTDRIYQHFFDSKWSLFNEDIARRGVTVLSNPDKLVPIQDLDKNPIRLVYYGTDTYRDFRQKLGLYTNYQLRHGKEEANNREVVINDRLRYLDVLLLGADQYISPEDSSFFAGLASAKNKKQLIVINFGAPQQVSGLDSTFTVLQAYTNTTETASVAAQILTGGLGGRGKSPLDLNNDWKNGQGQFTDQIRVSFGPSEWSGIRPEKLVGIHAIAHAAIREKATPGCQIVVIKDGNVLFDQAYGYHTYKKDQAVHKDDLYDIASVSKIASTTLVAMHDYEKGLFKINDRVREHLPEYQKAPFRNVRIKELMTHRSGIQPHLPVIPYLKYRGPGNTNCDSFFCKTESEKYNVQVAENFFFQQRLQDKIWEDMNEVSIKRFTNYRYSDANMVLVQRLLESKHEQKLDQLIQSYFYQPMGLKHITYRPLEKFSKEKIVPTEKDDRWRRQLVHGYVHDESAALLGGVAGHAGIFSNAEDLAILMQMLLNGGSYANHQYLSPETIELFTSDKHGNHRGLGFDKRHSSNQTGRAYDLSANAYGHTGFTGTCAWVDPDHNLVFVFLSNRLHPNVRNRKLFSERVRTRIHQVVYDALDSYEPQWPDLEI